MSQEQKEVTFPAVNIMVGKDGIVIETFFAPTVSIRQVIGELQVNEMLKIWLGNRQQLQEQQRLIQDVMKHPKLH